MNVRAWGQIAAAIALVAEGRYPTVVISNICDAARLAAALQPDADSCGVDLVVLAGTDGTAHDVVVRKR